MTPCFIVLSLLSGPYSSSAIAIHCCCSTDSLLKFDQKASGFGDFGYTQPGGALLLESPRGCNHGEDARLAIDAPHSVDSQSRDFGGQHLDSDCEEGSWLEWPGSALRTGFEWGLSGIKCLEISRRGCLTNDLGLGLFEMFPNSRTEVPLGSESVPVTSRDVGYSMPNPGFPLRTRRGRPLGDPLRHASSGLTPSGEGLGRVYMDAAASHFRYVADADECDWQVLFSAAFYFSCTCDSIAYFTEGVPGPTCPSALVPLESLDVAAGRLTRRQRRRREKEIAEVAEGMYSGPNPEDIVDAVPTAKVTFDTGAGASVAPTSFPATDLSTSRGCDFAPQRVNDSTAVVTASFVEWTILDVEFASPVAVPMLLHR